MKRRISFTLAVAAFVLAVSGCRNGSETIGGSDSSKMEWWEDARFGMFIHWGLYSIPAGEWNGETHHAEWIRTTAHIPLDVYDTLVNYFNPVLFDADEWVRTARDAGMKYIVITSKHHDGFSLFDSEYSDFDVMSTPFRRDILSEMADACKKHDIVLCFYHSIMDWHHPDYLPRRDWEKDRTGEGADMSRFIVYLKGQLKELTTRYGRVGVLWFDGEWEDTWTHEMGVDLYNYASSLQPGIIINNRVDKGRQGMQGMTSSDEYKGDFGTPEQEVPPTGLPGTYWESCITLNDHWGYNKADNNWKSTDQVIRMLADIASKGGNLLLNVGPKPDGTFPEESIEILSGAGEWMGKNSEAIYGTGPSPFRYLPWGRCTVKTAGRNTNLYLHVFNWPDNGQLAVPGLGGQVKKVFLLAGGESLRYEDKGSGIMINVPAMAPDAVNTVIVVVMKGSPVVVNTPEIAPAAGEFVDLMTVSVEEIPEGLNAFYTTDGSEPTSQSAMFAGPLTIGESSEVRVAFFRNGERVSEIAAADYRKVTPVRGMTERKTSPGLAFSYYMGDFDSLPDFERLKPHETGISEGVTLAQAGSGEYFALRFSGFVKIEKDAVYLFSLTSDDGSRLTVNGMEVITNDGLHGPVEETASLALGEGLHSIEVQFFQKAGGMTLNLEVAGPEGKIPGNRVFVH